MSKSFNDFHSSTESSQLEKNKDSPLHYSYNINSSNTSIKRSSTVSDDTANVRLGDYNSIVNHGRYAKRHSQLEKRNRFTRGSGVAGLPPVEMTSNDERLYNKDAVKNDTSCSSVSEDEAATSEPSRRPVGPRGSGQGGSQTNSQVTPRQSGHSSHQSTHSARVSSHSVHHGRGVIRPTLHVYEFGHPPENSKPSTNARTSSKPSVSGIVLKDNKRRTMNDNPSEEYSKLQESNSGSRLAPTLAQNLDLAHRRLTNSVFLIPQLERPGGSRRTSVWSDGFEPPAASGRRKSAVMNFVFRLRYHSAISDKIKDMYTDEDANGYNPQGAALLEAGLLPMHEALRRARRDLANTRAGLNCFRLLVHDLLTWWRRRRLRREDNPVLLNYIKAIEGQFGSGIVSFFIFLRWVFMLNVGLAVIWLILVLLPQAYHFDSSSITSTFYMRDLLIPEHAVGESVLFYGQYQQTLDGYPMPLMYLICILLTYFGGLFIVLHSLARALEEEGGSLFSSQFTFGYLVFSSWDYSLSSKEGSINLSMGIANSFRDVMHELKVKHTTETRSRTEALHLLVRRGLAWAITLLLVSGGCALIFYTMRSDFALLLAEWGFEVSQDGMVATVGPTLIFVLVNIIIPEILYLLPMFEKYVSGKKEMYSDIARVFVFRTLSILALVVSLDQKVKQGHFRGCAGTIVGQELYKFVVLDTIAGIVTVLAPNFLFYAWEGKKVEFMMPPHVLKILYRQALIWLGALVCPLLPLIGAVSILIFFMCCVLCVKVTCKPPEKRWNQSRRNTFFMTLTGATLCCMIGVVSVIIGTTYWNNLRFANGDWIFSIERGRGPVFFMCCVVCVKSTCKPPEKRWNQSRRNAFFMTLTGATLCCMIGVVSFIIGTDDLFVLGRVGESEQRFCGPFGNSTMTAAFTAWQRDMEIRHPAFGSVLAVLFSSTVIMPLVFVLFAVLYFQCVCLNWEKHRVHLLNLELHQERELSRELIKKVYGGSCSN